VLLIDADLRKPAFVTGVDRTDGLSKLLTNHDPLRDHVLRTETDGLSLLPSARCRPTLRSCWRRRGSRRCLPRPPMNSTW
jgi:MinD-like ATPase involved in chromosome partitioning or flagellar assembly